MQALAPESYRSEQQALRDPGNTTVR